MSNEQAATAAVTTPAPNTAAPALGSPTESRTGRRDKQSDEGEQKSEGVGESDTSPGNGGAPGLDEAASATSSSAASASGPEGRAAEPEFEGAGESDIVSTEADAAARELDAAMAEINAAVAEWSGLNGRTTKALHAMLFRVYVKGRWFALLPERKAVLIAAVKASLKPKILEQYEPDKMTTFDLLLSLAGFVGDSREQKNDWVRFLVRANKVPVGHNLDEFLGWAKLTGGIAGPSSGKKKSDAGKKPLVELVEKLEIGGDAQVINLDIPLAAKLPGDCIVLLAKQESPLLQGATTEFAIVDWLWNETLVTRAVQAVIDKAEAAKASGNTEPGSA